MLRSYKRRPGALALAAAIGGVVGFSASRSFAQNLLLDPGFEPDATTGLPNAATGDQSTSPINGPDANGPWEGYNDAQAPYTGFITAVTNHTTGGSQCGKGYGYGTYASGIRQNVNGIVPGDAYTAQMWFESLSTDAINAAGDDGQRDVAQMTFFTGQNGSGANLYTVSAPTFSGLNADGSENQNNWVQETVTAQAISTIQSIQVQAFYTDPNGYLPGAMYVDDAALIDTTFNGKGTTNNFSDAGNWNGVAPGAFAPLVFGNSTLTTVNNDTPAYTPHYGIYYTTRATAYTLTGNIIDLTSDVVNNSSVTQTINLPLNLAPANGTVINFSANNGNIVVGGAIDGTASVNKNGNFTLTLSGASNYSGGTTVQTGPLVVASASALGIGGGLGISSGASVKFAIPGAPAAVTLISLGVSGQLDLGTDALDLPGASLSSINPLVQSGYAGGTWNGATGIMSSSAAGDSRHITAVGVIVNDNGSGMPLYGTGGTISTTFDGVSPADGDVLVKYTYYGDTDLNGKVDGSDYSRIDNAYANNKNTSAPQLTGWYNGDFNYDGVIDGSDYTLMDNAFNIQGAQLASAIAGPTAQGGSSAVPEPATLALLGIGALGLLGRSRKSS